MKKTKNMITKKILNATTAISLCLFSSQAMSNPVGGSVSAGEASISSRGKTVTINQRTDKAIIDWKSFDVDKGERVRFAQPSSSSVVLNRISGSGAASMINGTIDANGHVFIVNPNGVMIGSSARVNVGSLVVSTADTGNDEFMKSSGIYEFNKAGNHDAKIINEGTITIAESGLATLVAPEVVNNGTINVRLAKLQMASADTFAVDMYGDGLISLAVDEKYAERLLKVENTGTINANGGEVRLDTTAAGKIVDSLINMEGVIQANDAEKRSGKVTFINSKSKVEASGKVDSKIVLDKEGVKISAVKESETRFSNYKIDTDGENVHFSSDRGLDFSDSYVKTNGGSFSIDAADAVNLDNVQIITASGEINIHALAKIKIEKSTLITSGGKDDGALKIDAEDADKFRKENDGSLAEGKSGNNIMLIAEKGKIDGEGNCIIAGGYAACGGEYTPLPVEEIPTPEPVPVEEVPAPTPEPTPTPVEEVEEPAPTPTPEPTPVEEVEIPAPTPEPTPVEEVEEPTPTPEPTPAEGVEEPAPTPEPATVEEVEEPAPSPEPVPAEEEEEPTPAPTPDPVEEAEEPAPTPEPTPVEEVEEPAPTPEISLPVIDPEPTADITPFDGYELVNALIRNGRGDVKNDLASDVRLVIENRGVKETASNSSILGKLETGAGSIQCADKNADDKEDVCKD